MSDNFMNLEMFRQPQVPLAESAALEIVIADAGHTHGIDVTIYAVGSDQIVFETVLLDPDSQTLLTHGSAETEAFWQCLNLHCCANYTQDIFLTARCRFNPLAIAVSTERIGGAETRNVRFLRLIEAILDELETRKPGSAVQVAIVTKNNKVIAPIKAACECPRCSKF